MKVIRTNMLKEPLFRFDYYIKSLKEGALSKRVASIVKMLANEADYLKSERYKQIKEEETKKIKEKREKEKQKEAKLKRDRIQEEKATKKINTDNALKRKLPKYIGPMNLVQSDVITVEDDHNDHNNAEKAEEPEIEIVNNYNNNEKNGSDMNETVPDTLNGDHLKKKQLNLFESFERVSSSKK